MATKIVPSIHLRGVNPLKVSADYRAGKYRDFTPPASRVQIAELTAIIAPSYGDSPYSSTYSFRDRNNSLVVIPTSNHKAFEVFNATGEIPGGVCDNCGVKFTHPSIGIPVAMGLREFSIREQKDDPGEVRSAEKGPQGSGETSEGTPACSIVPGAAPGADRDSGTGEACADKASYKTQNVFVFWVEGCYHSYECGLATCFKNAALPTCHRDPNYSDSEAWLRQMYKLAYPDAPPLRAAPDRRLHAARHGPLDPEKYENRHHVYRRTTRCLLIPAKVEYVEYIRHD